MDPKYKTLIPLIIISFILGAAVGYVAHKPETKIEYHNTTIEVEKIVTVTVTVTPTPTPMPTLTPTPTPAVVADFTVKIYEPSKDVPTKTVTFDNLRANPSEMSIKPGDTVLFKITDYTASRMTLVLNESVISEVLSYSGGAVVITFNNKGTYRFKAIIPSSDPSIAPRTYAEGTINVY